MNPGFSILALLAVLVVLLLGLYTLLRGRENTRLSSNRLMRWRVVLQALAIVILMATVYFGARGGGG